MDIIRIRCNECTNYNECDVTLIDCDENLIKNIISSNYVTFIEICCHNKNTLTNYLINCTEKFSLYNYSSYYAIYNLKYSELYGVFKIEKYYHIDSELIIYPRRHHFHNTRIININEFLRIVKKGTMIDVTLNAMTELEKILLEHNCFTLKKIIKKNLCYYMVDIKPTITKPAMH